jgi:hypothetical protein
MDDSERRMRYLEIYRQQLRSEMAAMGYGQPYRYILSIKKNEKES